MKLKMPQVLRHFFICILEGYYIRIIPILKKA